MSKDLAISMLHQGQDGETILRILDTILTGFDGSDDPEPTEVE
jgi:hypothetical protein